MRLAYYTFYRFVLIIERLLYMYLSILYFLQSKEQNGLTDWLRSPPYSVGVQDNKKGNKNRMKDPGKIPLLQARAFHGLFNPHCTIKQWDKQRARILNNALSLAVLCSALLGRQMTMRQKTSASRYVIVVPPH